MARLAVAFVLAIVLPPRSVESQQEQRYPQVHLNGIVFGHYIYRTDDAADGMNRFDLERAELTAQGLLAERTRFRVSIDVLPPPAAAPGGAATGWNVRARYAFVDHDLLRGGRGSALSARIGMIHNVIIGQHETFWPRWILRSPVDRAGYFSSSDLGAGVQITLPSRLGSFYATAMNGPGIGSPEVDRYKDLAARFTLTPWARSETPGLRGTALSLWGSNGALGSRFAAGGPGQEGPVDAQHRRDRWGVHLGVREPMLLAGVSWSRRLDEAELGANTPDDPRRVEEREAELLSVHGHLRPSRLGGGEESPLGVIARWDRSTGVAAHDFYLAGLTWDLAERTSIAVDYQSQRPRGTSSAPRSDAWLFQFVFSF